MGREVGTLWLRYLREHSMTDPVLTTLVAAFTVGAAKGATEVGESAVKDAYAAFRQLVIDGYGAVKRAVEQFEEKPDSEGRKSVLGEELAAARALDDERLLAAARTVLMAAEHSRSAVGIDWHVVRAAEVEIGKIRAGANATGLRIGALDVGKFTIGEVEAGGGAGN